MNNFINNARNARNTLKKASITKIIIVILVLALIISINQANKYKIILNYQKDTQTQGNSSKKGNKVELQPGEYKIDGSVGNLTEGTYNIYAKEGYGLLIGDLEQGYIAETIGIRSTGITKGISRTYEGLCLVKGDKIEIKGECVLVFEPIE